VGGHIPDEVEEGGAEGSDAAVSEDAVADGSHGVLAHSKSQVAAGGSLLLEITRTLRTHTNTTHYEHRSNEAHRCGAFTFK
jgi:hypothetical protein